MNVERISSQLGTPYDLDHLAAHCRVTSDVMLVELDSLGGAAAAEIEKLCNLALLTQTIRVTLIGWPCGQVLHLPIGPVLTDATATMTVDGVPFTAFSLLTGQRPKLCLTDEPDSALRAGTVVIEYPAGFGAKHHFIPEDIAHAIADQAVTLFDGRGVGDAREIRVSPAVWRVAARYRRVAI